MRTMLRFHTSALVAVSLVAGPVMAAAQPAPAASTQPSGGDPPARVGRLAEVHGGVSFHLPGADRWDKATVNYPVTSGDAVWTEPGARAVVEVSGARLVLAPSTELDIDTLDEHTLSATAPQGEVCVIVQSLAPGQSMDVRTPRGVVTIATPGRYGIASGDTDHPTAVTVLAGAAQVQGGGVDFQLAAGQTGLVTGTDTFQSQTVTAQGDAFLAGQCEPPPPVRAAPVAQASPPAAVAMMVGADDLAQYGTWQPSPQYGSVWYPQVAANWVPYRDGHWAYVAPWGWTWVDNEPWGFAPSHYGRWAEFDGRWGWVPSAYAVQDPGPPVYAPALVSFVEPGAALAAGVAVGALAGAAVGWLPLGPHEPYRPWYHASDTYIRDVNVRYVRPGAPLPNGPPPMNGFVNRAAATMVPAAVMTGSRAVAGAARPIPPAQFAALRPVTGPVPVQPTRATAGVTQGLATRMNLSQGTPPASRFAPGPSAFAERTDPRAPVPLRGPGGRAAPVHAGAPGGAPPPGGPGAVSAPHAGLPSLVTPGERGRMPGQPGAPGPAIVPHGAGTPEAGNRPPERAPGAMVAQPAGPGQQRPGEPSRAERPGQPGRPEVVAPHAAAPHVGAPAMAHAPQAPGAPHQPAAPRVAAPPHEAARVEHQPAAQMARPEPPHRPAPQPHFAAQPPHPEAMRAPMHEGPPQGRPAERERGERRDPRERP